MGAPTGSSDAPESAVDGSLRTQPYRIARPTIAWIAIEEYVRRFWWLVASLPVFGILLLAFVQQPTAQIVGAVALAWPISIPARGVLATLRSGRKFGEEVSLEATEDTLLFHRAQGGGWKLRLGAIQGVVRMRGHFVLRLAGLGFVPVPERAFDSPEDVERFATVLEARR